MADSRDSSSSEDVRVEGSIVRSGNWSGNLAELAADSRRLHQLLAGDRVDEARALLRSRSAEEQAALVAIDADPEQVLALTASDGRGLPAYSREVVDRLPSELLARLAAPDARHSRYNPAILRAMSPRVFERTVRDVLDPIDNPDLRTSVAWEWLEAVAALGDPSQAAALLRAVDPAALEEAVMDRLTHLDLGRTTGHTEVAAVSLFQTMSEGFAWTRPSDYVADAATAEVLDALWEAAPDLLASTVVNATRRLHGTG